MSESPSRNLASRVQVETVLAQVNAALSTGNVEQAIRLAGDAIAAGVEHPLFYNLAASLHEDRHDYAQAIELLQRGLQLAPNDLNMLTALGLCLNKVRRADAALGAFDKVLETQPDFAPAHYGKGVALLYGGDIDGARSAFERAAGLLPGYAEPIGSLAALEVRLGDARSGRSLAERALAMDPRLVSARSALAACELEAGALETAEVLARKLLDDRAVTGEDRSAVGITLGDALDRQGRHDEAFVAYETAKSISRQINAGEFERPGAETYPAYLDRLFDAFSDLLPGEWRPAPAREDSGAAGHAFVMGFARSGTTLLETALATHPAIVSLDESNALKKAGEETTGVEAMRALAGLDETRAMRWRRIYWDRVAELGVDVAGKVFVDKNPFASLQLPLIAALFPRAKVLFALRDPRDVVLSCFRRSFTISAGTFQFTTLEGAARFYDRLMKLAMLYREKLPLDLHEVRYELLCRDFETEARSAAEFLEVEWTPEMKNFAATARNRPSRTPSARQLARGLYSGAGQWRPYARQLEPVMPILEPWLERFGYAGA
jgi:tetratricopeptide (TPR) repeat protein